MVRACFDRALPVDPNESGTDKNALFSMGYPLASPRGYARAATIRP